MEQVTGIGGVFFRRRDPMALVAWYAEHLGVPVNEEYVGRFRWATNPEGNRFELWPPLS